MKVFHILSVNGKKFSLIELSCYAQNKKHKSVYFFTSTRSILVSVFKICCKIFDCSSVATIGLA